MEIGEHLSEKLLKIIHVVGARPNFMKAAPVIGALRQYPQVEQLLVHTGQHYDVNMSAVFFRELGLPEPDVNLEVGSGSHAVQTAEVMTRFEKVVLEKRPNWVIVYGDVNSTVAVALVCAKLFIPVAHVEAGLRSYDRTMPEEINRLLTDQLASLLFTPSPDADNNLKQEGISLEKIHCVGNVMIDSLIRLLPQAATRWPVLQQQLKLQTYGLVTLHRPSNVDDSTTLQRILTTLAEISQELPLLFPIHPRTRARLHDWQFDNNRLKLIEPVGYLDFLALQQHATLVITDSGGIQEETTYLGVTCLTVRENTERPITVTLGTNILVGQEMVSLKTEVARTLRGEPKKGQIPPLWDGKTGERIAQILTQVMVF